MFGLLLVLYACTNESQGIQGDEGLQRAVADYFEVLPGKVSVSVREQVEDYAWISVSFSMGDKYAGGGGVGVAHKELYGSWRVVFMGNGLPECRGLYEENFPEELRVTCVDGTFLIELPSGDVLEQ